MPINKITLASRILATLNHTAYCNGVFYFYNKKFYEELTDFDFHKVIRKFFIANKLTESWSKNIASDLIAAMKIEIAEKNEVIIMDNYSHHIPILNGVIDLSDLTNITVNPHDPKYTFSYVVPVEWNNNTNYQQPIKFLQFLNDTFRNNHGEPNQNTVETILYIMAYVIYPEITMEKFFMFLGNGANGKSFLISILKMFFKPSHVTYASLQTLADDQSNNRDFMIHSRLNIAGEQKGVRVDPEEIKKIASGQDLQVIVRYKGNVSFKPKAKLIIDSNNTPYFSDNTHGTKRRLCIVNFSNNFLEDDDYVEKQKLFSNSVNPEIYSKLDLSMYGIYRQREAREMFDEIKTEISEIFNLLLVYLAKLKSKKWQIPKNEDTEQALNEYESNTDFLKIWLLENFERNDIMQPLQDSLARHPEQGLTIDYIYTKFWNEYTDEHGKHHQFKKNTIAKRITELFRCPGEKINIRLSDGRRTKTSVYPLKEKMNFGVMEM